MSLKTTAVRAIVFGMETTYRLNTKELGGGFINAIKDVYPDRDIEITVREREETEYLLTDPQLCRAVSEIEQGRGLVNFDSLDEAVEAARSPV